MKAITVEVMYTAEGAIDTKGMKGAFSKALEGLGKELEAVGSRVDQVYSDMVSAGRKTITLPELAYMAAAGGGNEAIEAAKDYVRAEDKKEDGKYKLAKGKGGGVLRRDAEKVAAA